MRIPVSLGCALILSFASVTGADSKPDHAKQRHQVITIDDSSVHPAVLRVSPEDVVVFLSYVGGREIQVRFPETVEGKFECAVDPSFYRTGGGGLVSRPFGSLEFALPCRLEPGTYDYRILGLFGGHIVNMDDEDPGDPKGKIIVESGP